MENLDLLPYNNEAIKYMQRGGENKNFNILGEVLSACTLRLYSHLGSLYKNPF